MVWACAKTRYQRTSKKDKKVEFRRLTKRTRKTEDDIEDKSEKNMNKLDLNKDG